MLTTNEKKNANRMRHGEVVKENVFEDGVVSLRWLAAALAACGAALCAALLVDARLPAPLTRSAPPDRFIAEIAHEHLVNLSSIGPRVAGSYENEVLAVRVLVEAVKRIAAQASPHNVVEFDVFSASGAFSLTFLDGMSNMYRDVQGVVARARGAGGRAAASRHALLLNCHFDTVPDSPDGLDKLWVWAFRNKMFPHWIARSAARYYPTLLLGASDDAAGCAVALETLRALAAEPRPLRHDVLVLLNGAEENILQASHAFVTQHAWAKAARAFINIEACGAGGREVLFQAGPHDPWIMEVYAGAVPHPFASSLAQELFESGLIPADTDFRIFRDYGNLSGVDLAWSSNGYVYHTRLDTAERVAPAVLQRTGDNVLALARGMLASERLRDATEAAGQPVYFDVLGAYVVAARAPAAALAALLAALAAAAALLRSARDAARELHVGARAWGGVAARAAAGAAAAAGAGAAAAAAAALALHAAGARLSFYARPWLLLPLYALPALMGASAAARSLWRRVARRGGAAALARGWWAWRAWRDGQLLCALLLLLAGAALRLRSAFLPALWTLPALGVWARRRSDGAAAALAAALAALPALQSAYLALGSINMFVPIMGRAGTAPLPPDVLMALVVSQLTLLTCSWALPLVVAARRPAPLFSGAAALTALVAALVLLTPLGAPYSAERPQRFMVLHTRRTVHAALPPGDMLDTDVSNATHEDFYWIPELDVNTPHSMDPYVPELAAAQATTAAECARWPYCGAPYFLPVLSLVARGHRVPAPAPPRAALRLAARLLPAAAPGERELELELREAPAHVVLVLAPAPGARVAHCAGLGAPQEGPRWGARRTYLVALHQARRPRAWRLRCRLAGGAGGARWLRVAAGGHAMAGAARRAAAHARLLAALPATAAPTGWGVHLHLFEL